VLTARTAVKRRRFLAWPSSIGLTLAGSPANTASRNFSCRQCADDRTTLRGEQEDPMTTSAAWLEFVPARRISIRSKSMRHTSAGGITFLHFEQTASSDA
jgi:hypothetical protein